MPSAKATRVQLRKNQQKQPLRTKARTFVSKARRLIAEGDVEAAVEASTAAIVALDKAAQRGAIHSNIAARRKSRLLKSLNETKSDQEKMLNAED